MKEIVVPPDPLGFSVAHFVKQATIAIEEKGSFWVALSGGSTPKKIYEKLTTPPFKDHIDWEAIHLFWSDERAVPPDHPDSNYKMAMEAGFQHMPIPPGNIHRMEAEKEDLFAAAYAYEETIRRVTCGQGLDMIMLGMGADGHTASLFPHSKALFEDKAWVLPNYIEEKQTWRMTFTYPCLDHGRLIVVYVIGGDKATRLAQVMTTKPNFEEVPIVKLGPSLWIVDQAASALLENSGKQ